MLPGMATMPLIKTTDLQTAISETEIIKTYPPFEIEFENAAKGLLQLVGSKGDGTINTKLRKTYATIAKAALSLSAAIVSDDL
jgi:hypothetical protein